MIKVAIFGVGLIGGSLAMCFKGKPGVLVAGHSSKPESVEKFKQRNVVDLATTSMQEAAEDADFVFLCGPVGALEEQLRRVSGLKLKPGCIITDVGSTKRSIAECASSLSLGEAVFIGGHPMAGSERSGVEAASVHLYENAFYVLTPDESVPAEAYDRLVQLLKHTKAQIIRLDPALHDQIVGAISHLPHALAAALVNQVAGYNAGSDLYQQLIAGGFLDFTRIASSDPVIWRDIVLHNREVLLQQLGDWDREMGRFTRLLQDRDEAGLEEFFHTARTFRSQLPERRKGMTKAIYDLYVDVPDHPGVIGHIASRLGDAKINLSNIQIIEGRLDMPGVLRLSFREESDWERAADVLRECNYSIHY